MMISKYRQNKKLGLKQVAIQEGDKYNQRCKSKLQANNLIMKLILKESMKEVAIVERNKNKNICMKNSFRFSRENKFNKYRSL